MIAGTRSRDISRNGETRQIFNTFGSLMHFQPHVAPTCHEDSHYQPIVPCQTNQLVIPRTFGGPIIRPEHPVLSLQWHKSSSWHSRCSHGQREYRRTDHKRQLVTSSPTQIATIRSSMHACMASPPALIRNSPVLRSGNRT
jgi:hypothetical protein